MTDLFERTHISEWLHRVGELASSRAVLEALALQLAILAAAWLLAWAIRAVTRLGTDRLVERFDRHLSHRIPRTMRGLATPCYAWLLLVLAERVAASFGLDLELVRIAASLTAVWIVVRASSLLLRDPGLARGVAILAWCIAALDILGLLAPTAAALDSLAITIGKLQLSVLLVLKAALILAVLLWVALELARLISGRLQRIAGLSPSVQVLTGNLLKIALVMVALVIGLNAVGIDLTAFAVFSGAIGVGIGFGLQKIVSNFVSGIILLLERSVKPGDVIEVGKTYGSITSLGARYCSVRGRDGKEYLIPNENLIANQVVNWSYSNPQIRLDVEFGVGYESDLNEVRALAIAAGRQVKRVLGAPPAVCHITGFGDNAVNMLLRFWIEDPANGVTNVKGDVLLALWNTFREHGIELPFPQRELRIREVPASMLRAVEAAAETRSAAE